MAYTGNQGFGGLDARRAASDGAIRDMENMSLRFSPAIASRTARRRIATGWKSFRGAYYGNRDYVVRDNKLYDNGTAVSGLTLTSGEKSMAMLDDKIYIFPDKIEYYTKSKTVKDYKLNINNVDGYTSKNAYIDFYKKESGGDIITTTYYAAALVFPTRYFPSAEFPFKTGEWVRIRITKIQEIYYYKNVSFDLYIKPEQVESGESTEYGDFKAFRLPLNTFDAITGMSGGTTARLVEVQVDYSVPDLDFIFASDNRLWGAKDGEIYASALGQGMVWRDYDTLTTSSWTASTKTGDNITAGVDFGGMPVFFCENAAYKIYGENPKEFQYARQDLIGVTAGDHKSVAAGAGYIFYATRRGIYAWTGGVPQLISAPLGDGRITEPVGGSDGVVYYLSCKQDDRQNLYVFDPTTFTWVREDATKAVDIQRHGQDLCMVTSGSEAWLIGDVFSTSGTAESGYTYSLETGEYNDGSVTVKAAKNILLQHELKDGQADVSVSYDGEPWEHVYTLYDTDGKRITSVIPLREKRYRTMKIRIEGDGEIIIYYMMRDVTVLTERTGGEKNVYQ